MKAFLFAFIAFLSITTASNANAQWCPSSPQIDAEAVNALDNLQTLEDEINYFYPERAHITTISINSVRVNLVRILEITENPYNTCLSIKSAFYNSDLNIYDLSQNIGILMGHDRNASPLAPFWDTFLNSFLILENTIELAPGTYTIPRGSYYRRYFPRFVIRRGLGIEFYPGVYTYTYPTGIYRHSHRRTVRSGRVHPRRRIERRSTGTRIERRSTGTRVERRSTGTRVERRSTGTRVERQRPSRSSRPATNRRTRRNRR